MRPLPRRTPDLRPPPKSPLRTLLVTAVTTTLVGAALALATAPAQAENRVTPGDFTGYGFDQCLAPSQSKMDTWMEYSPFSSVGIYISGDSRACRSQPNLTRTWISRQLAQPVAHPPDHPRPAGLLPAAVPALRRRREDQPDRHQQLRQGPLAGPGRGGQDGQGGAGAGHQPGQHAVVRPRGLRPRQHPLPRVRALLPARLDQADPPARLRLRRLLQRRLRHQDAGRRAGQPARHLRVAGQDLDRPVGRRGEHLHVVHPLRRLAARRPREAVPGRPQRDLGRRHDQHRPQLPRHRQGTRPGPAARTAAR